MKIAVNKCFGGFDLSLAAQKMYCEKRGLGFYPYEQVKYNHRDGMEEYRIIQDINKSSLFVNVSTEFLGDICSEIPNDKSWYYGNIDRSDKDLVEVIEELGSEASGRCGNIKIVEIPDDVDWEIDDYDGIETVHEVHRSW